MARIVCLDVGQMGVCCYLVAPDAGASPGGADDPAVVIDPGDEADRVDAELRRLGLRLEMVLLTHAHFDHIGGVDALLAKWPGAALACSAETSRRIGDPSLNLSGPFGQPVRAKPAGRTLADGETFRAAGLEWRAVEVPGHDPGELVYILGKGEATFSGDTLFAGSVGRSDFPGGDGRALAAGVKKLLAALPPDSPVYPGHGPATTAGEELRSNPFL